MATYRVSVKSTLPPARWKGWWKQRCPATIIILLTSAVFDPNRPPCSLHDAVNIEPDDPDTIRHKIGKRRRIRQRTEIVGILPATAVKQHALLIKPRRDSNRGLPKFDLNLLAGHPRGDLVETLLRRRRAPDEPEAPDNQRTKPGADRGFLVHRRRVADHRYYLHHDHA